MRKSAIRNRFGHSLLSSREFEVASLVRQGLSNKAIAHELAISVGTAATHIRRASRKLGVDSRRDLIVTVACQSTCGSRVPPKSAGHDHLTAAERVILAAILQGLTNGEVAIARNRSVRTVAVQVSSVMKKLDVKCRAEIISRFARAMEGSIEGAPRREASRLE